MNEKQIMISPLPKALTVRSENLFSLKSAVTADNSGFGSYLDAFIGYAEIINGVKLAKGTGGILFAFDEKLAESEYRIDCTEGGVTAYASSDDGLTCAMATLHQLISNEDGALSVPDCMIADNPDCSYRALMVDLARQWHPYETLKEYVDLCYIYKIKFIHLHFADMQSYTLPSSLLPKLSTEGRHYTFDQIVDLNNYCLERNIEIIPELEFPGHATSLTLAYPELFCDTPFYGAPDTSIVCAGKEGIMDTIRGLYEELISMFPNSRYIHVGGDEARISAWENCSACQAYMQKNGINGKYALYTDFIKRVTDLVLSLGRTPIVWEGFPVEGNERISRDVIVTAWESLYHLPNQLLHEGFTVTNSSWLPLYIVPDTHPQVIGGRWYADDIMNWNIYTWRNWFDQSAAYEKPIVVAPTDKVIGGTLCAWECDYKQDIVPVKENLAALSERLWNIELRAPKEELISAIDRVIKLADNAVGKYL